MRWPIPIEEHVPLAPLTTLGVGGPARFLARCADLETLQLALATARTGALATHVHGGGSNLVVADAGFDGLVLVPGDERVAIDIDSAADVARVMAGAGVVWDALVLQTTAAGLGGLECLSGIPGCVGAAPIQNIGAYGQEVSGTIAQVHAVERSTGQARIFAADECSFGYRTSRFKTWDRDRWVVVSVEFRLPVTRRGVVAYRDLEKHFANAPRQPTPAEVRAAVLAIRRTKSMVIVEDDPNRRSAGSFFVNPVVSAGDAARVADAAGSATMPAFPAPDGHVKLSAGWLIEAAGFRRGFRRGAVGLSSRHALAIVNHGGASASEVLAFAGTIRRGVARRFGVVLVPEPNLIGFDDDVDTLLDG